MAKKIEIDNGEKFFIETRVEVEDGKFKTYDDHPIYNSEEEAIRMAKGLVDNHDHIKTAKITKEVGIYKED